MLKKCFFIGLLILNFSAFTMDAEYSKLEDKEPGDKATEGLMVDNLSEPGKKFMSDVLDEEIEKREKLIKIFGEILPVDVFFKAVETNNLALAKFCFENEIGDIDLKNKDNQTPLMLAVKKMNLDMVKLFLENKASVHHVDLDGNNALHYIMICHAQSAQDKGDKSVSRFSPSNYYSKLEDIIELLLNNGININSCDNNGDTLLIKLLRNKAPFKVARMISQFHPDINVVNKSHMTAVNYMSCQERETIEAEIDLIKCNCVIL